MTEPILVAPQGLHLETHKHLSRHQPIQAFEPCEDLIFPLLDKRFGLINPMVSSGDDVIKGQLIAQHDQWPSLNLFASVSGTVKSIEQRQLLNQQLTPCLIIEPKADDKTQFFTPIDYKSASYQQLLNRVAEAGIIGLGGAGFPSAKKLPVSGEAINELIINAAECEPFITADERLIVERVEQIAEAIDLLQTWLQPKHIKIAIEDDKPEAIAALRAGLRAELKADSEQSSVDIIVLKTQYPSGSERLLIQALSNIRLKPGQLPADAGVVCFNISTIYAIKQAVVDGKPLLSRIVTVTGDKISQVAHYEVPIGTKVSELLAHSDTHITKDAVLIHGGSMMGQRFTHQDMPVLKTTHCIVYDSSEQQPKAESTSCIRCGKCADVCPEKLLPQELHWQAKEFDADKLQQLRLMDCIECGACDYVCPSAIPLVSEFQQAKGSYKKEQQEKHKSELSKQRFEKRNLRIEKRKQALAERRKLRKLEHQKESNKKTEQLEQAHIKQGVNADLAKLKAEAAKAESIYNQAQKALIQAKKMKAPKLDALEAQVEKLKQHAELAKQRVLETGG